MKTRQHTLHVVSRPFELHIISTATKILDIDGWGKVEKIKEEWNEKYGSEGSIRAVEDQNILGRYEVQCFYPERRVYDIQTLEQAEESAQRVKSQNVPHRFMEIWRKVKGREKTLIKRIP